MQGQTQNDNVVFKAETVNNNFLCNMTVTEIPDKSFLCHLRGQSPNHIKLKILCCLLQFHSQ